MKKKFFLLMVISSVASAVYAQGQQTYTENIDRIYARVSKTGVNTGIFYDRVFPWARLYNMGKAGHPDTASSSLIRQAAFELQLASISANPFSDAYDKIYSLRQKYKDNKTVPLVLLDADYNIVDSAALRKGIIVFNTADSTLGPPDALLPAGSTPFLKNRVTLTALCPGFRDGAITQSQFYIKLDSGAVFSNTGRTISSVVLHMPNGVVTISIGDSALCMLDMGSTNVNINCTIHYSDNSTTHTAVGEYVGSVKYISQQYSAQSIQSASGISPCVRIKYLVSALTFNENYGSDNYGACGGKNAEIPGVAELGIYLKDNSPESPSNPLCSSNKTFNGPDFMRASAAQSQAAMADIIPQLAGITNPIIVLDGFDPEDGRTIEHLYTQELSISGDLNNLLGNTLRGGRNGLNAQYDVIIVNFPDFYNNGNILVNGSTLNADNQIDHGAGFIERNGRTLITLIKALNKILALNKAAGLTVGRPVIVGPSMGGLISRYALNSMETDYNLSLPFGGDPTLIHDCRLWISFDSPHLGANIALGDQAFLNFYGTTVNNEGAYHSLDRKLRSPAARQLLIRHESQLGAGAGSDPMRVVFVKHLQDMIAHKNVYPSGYPALGNIPAHPMRRIAAIDGILSGGAAYPFPDHDEIFHSETYVKGFWRRLFTWLYTVTDHQVASSQAHFISNGNGYAEIFNGFYDMPSVWTLALPLVNSQYISFKVSGAMPNSTVSIDLAHGGQFPTQYIIDTAAIKRPDQNDSHTYFALASNKHNHCFIPARSSLAIGESLQYGDLGENLSNRDLVCSGETPFDSYVSPRIDTGDRGHVHIYPEMLTYVVDELNGNKTAHAEMPLDVFPNTNSITCDGVMVNATFSPSWATTDTAKKYLDRFRNGDMTWTLTHPNPLANLVTLDGNSVTTAGTPINLQRTDQNVQSAAFDVTSSFTTGRGELCKAAGSYFYTFPRFDPFSGVNMVFTGPSASCTTQYNHMYLYSCGTARISAPVIAGAKYLWSIGGNNSSQVSFSLSPSSTTPIDASDVWLSYSYNTGQSTTLPNCNTGNPINCAVHCTIIPPTSCGGSPHSVTDLLVTLCDPAQPISVYPPKGTPETGQITASFPAGSLPPVGTTASIYDAQGNLLQTVPVSADGTANFTTTGYNPNNYTITATFPDGSVASTQWPLMAFDGERLMVSPNPAISHIDDVANFTINNLKGNEAPFDVTINSQDGTLVQQFIISDDDFRDAQAMFNQGTKDYALSDQQLAPLVKQLSLKQDGSPLDTAGSDSTGTVSATFNMDISNLDPDIYTLTVTAQSGATWTDHLDMEMKGQPHLSISPNPASGVITGTLLDPLPGRNTITLTLTNSYGFTSSVQENAKIQGFSIDISNTSAGLYYLTASDGKGSYSTTVRIQ